LHNLDRNDNLIISISMNFSEFYYIFEQTQIKSKITKEDVKEVFEYLSRFPSFVEFIKKMNVFAVPFKEKKVGTLLVSKYFAFVEVISINDLPNGHREIEFRKVNNESFEDMAHLSPVFKDYKTKKEILLNTKYNFFLIDENRFRGIMNWITYTAINSPADLESFLSDVKAHDILLQSSLDDIKSIDATYQQLVQGYTEKKTSQDIAAGKSNKPGKEGRTILKFEDGWKWVSMDSPSCSTEADAAGHCGNVPGAKDDENLLSLRDANGRIHITMIVDANKVSNEVKGVANRKPKPYTHKYIMGLLMNTDQISQIGEGKYNPKDNFMISDLSKENINKLIKHGFLGDNWREQNDNIQRIQQEEWYPLAIDPNPTKFQEYAAKYGVEIEGDFRYSGKNNRLYVHYESLIIDQQVETNFKTFLGKFGIFGDAFQRSKDFTNKEFRNIFFKTKSVEDENFFIKEIRKIIKGSPDSHPFQSDFKKMVFHAYLLYTKRALNKQEDSRIHIQVELPTFRFINTQQLLYVQFFLEPESLEDFDKASISDELLRGQYRYFFNRKNEFDRLNYLLSLIGDEPDMDLFLECLDQVSMIFPFYTKWKIIK
jgi:hypothetical protein